MKSVIAISRGEYSDYQVLAIVEDEATADTWIQALTEEGEPGYNPPFKEVIAYVSSGEKPQKVTTHSYNATLWDDGNINEVNQWSTTEFPILSYYGPPPARPKVRYVRADCYKGRGGRLEVRGNSAEAVAKVANEKIAMWKAGAWAGPKYNEIVEEQACED